MVEIPDKSFLQLCIELLKHESFHNNEREKKEGGGVTHKLWVHVEQ